MSEDYKIQSAYEGGEFQIEHTNTGRLKVMEIPKSNHNITFTNADGHQVGTLDFNGPGLAFEGNAELSAIVFMDWVGKIFKARLEEEYARGLKDGKAA